jgi:TadE-like protein
MNPSKMHIVKSRRGIAALELALVAPGFLLLLLGMTDLVNYYRIQLRMDTASAQVAQIVSQCLSITTPGDTDQFWAHGQSLMGNQASLTAAPLKGTVVVSAVAMVGTAMKVRWQSRVGNTGYVSRVGVTGGDAVLAAGMVPDGQTLFVVEANGAPQQTFVLSQGFMASQLGQLTGMTLFLSRAPNPITLQSPPTNSAVKDCTA